MNVVSYRWINEIFFFTTLSTLLDHNVAHIFLTNECQVPGFETRTCKLQKSMSPICSASFIY